jgi:hypothetical protein
MPMKIPQSLCLLDMRLKREGGASKRVSSNVHCHLFTHVVLVVDNRGFNCLQADSSIRANVDQGGKEFGQWARMYYFFCPSFL